MTIHNPPGWLENAGDTHTAAQMRSYISGQLAGMNGSATSLIARGGVNPGLGNAFVVQAQGSPNMSVRVGSGVAYVPGGESTTQGCYGVLNDAEVTLAVSAAHASLPRIDSVVLRVRDSDYSGGNNDALLEIVAGTPASSPVAPTLTGNTLRLSNVTVGAAVSSITGGNIADTRRFATGLGGVMLVQAASNLTSIGTSEVEAGQLAWAISGSTLWIFNGASWEQIPFGVVGTKTRLFKSGDTPRTATTFVDDPHLQANGLPVNATYDFRAALWVVSAAANQGDIAIRFTHPGTGSARCTWGPIGLNNVPAASSSGPLESQSFNNASASPTGSTPFGTSTVVNCIHIEGVLFTGSAGGDLRLQWGLNTAVGTTTLLRDSKLILERAS